MKRKKRVTKRILDQGPDYNLSGKKWGKRKISWSLKHVDTDPFVSPPIGGHFAQAVEQAFAQWAKATNLEIEQAKDATSADIRLGWDSFETASDVKSTLLTTLNPAAITLAHCWTHWDEKNRYLPGTTIRINRKLNWVTDFAPGDPRQGQTYKFVAILLTQIGYALGLDTYNTATAVMNDTFKNLETLTTHDINGVVALYGRGKSTEPNVPPSVSTSPSASVPPGKSVAFASFIDAKDPDGEKVTMYKFSQELCASIPFPADKHDGYLTIDGQMFLKGYPDSVYLPPENGPFKGWYICDPTTFAKIKFNAGTEGVTNLFNIWAFDGINFSSPPSTLRVLSTKVKSRK